MFEATLSFKSLFIILCLFYVAFSMPMKEHTTRKMSYPFNNFDASPVLDGSLAGDAGFDPLRISKDEKSLFFYRECEIKHARIAMLAALGWPFSELYHFTIAKYFGIDYVELASQGRAPSVLNGGLDNVFILLTLGTFFAVGGVLEFEMMRQRREVPVNLRNFFNMWREDGWDIPGNYGFGKILTPMLQRYLFALIRLLCLSPLYTMYSAFNYLISILFSSLFSSSSSSLSSIVLS